MFSNWLLCKTIVWQVKLVSVYVSLWGLFLHRVQIEIQQKGVSEEMTNFDSVERFKNFSQHFHGNARTSDVAKKRLMKNNSKNTRFQLKEDKIVTCTADNTAETHHNGQ